MNYDKVVAEFSTIHETDFWKAYMARFRVLRDLLSRKCETETDADKWRECKGGITVLDTILGRNENPSLAVKLLTEIKEGRIFKEDK